MSALLTYLSALPIGNPNPIEVTVTGNTIFNQDVGLTNTGLRVNANGSIESLVDNFYAPIDVAMDWVRPASKNDIGFTVKLDVTSGDSPDTGSDSTGSYISVGNAQSREWYFTANGAGTWTVSISLDGSTALDSGAYVVTHDDLI
jgi:hypothetical protein